MNKIREQASQVALVVKNLAANAGDLRDAALIPRWRKIPWSRKWQPIPGLLPGKLHGQRSLVGYRSWGHKESDMTAQVGIQTIRNSGLGEPPMIFSINYSSDIVLC